MPGSTKLEAIVLRSIRYGEADRILHLLTPQRGRIGAIAKGARRARSRFGGRLEPFSRVALVLHEGRGDLLTVTGADSVDPHRPLREDAGTLDAAARSCDAVLKLFEDGQHFRLWRTVSSLFAFSLTMLAIFWLVLAKPAIELDFVPAVLHEPGGLGRIGGDLIDRLTP